MGILDRFKGKQEEKTIKSDTEPVLTAAELRVFNTLTSRSNGLRKDSEDMTAYIGNLKGERTIIVSSLDAKILEAENLKKITDDEQGHIESILTKLETIDRIDSERSKNREEFLSKRRLEIQ